jgi:phosphorylcholine metabolism protein LicD
MVKNSELEKYMTIPSIFVHCFDYGSNINNGKFIYSRKNPFDNVWKRYKKEEDTILTLLDNFGKFLDSNNMNYSIYYGTMLGYARINKILPYDDDINIIINMRDVEKIKNLSSKINTFCNIYTSRDKYRKGLYYKIYSLDDTIVVNNQDWKWPFIDIFCYDITNDNKLHDIYEDKKLDVSDITDKIILSSYNTNKTFESRIFRDYNIILDSLYNNWKNICISNSYNGMKENNIDSYTQFNCRNILPDYDKNTINEPFYKKVTGIKDYTILLFADLYNHHILLSKLILILIVLIIMIILIKKYFL